MHRFPSARARIESLILAVFVAALSHSYAHAASLALVWTDTSSNEDGFRIERMAPDGSFVVVGTVGPNVQTYVDSGLTAGRSYCYVVRAFNSAGVSDPSNGACGTPVESTGGSSGGGLGSPPSNGFHMPVTLSLGDSVSTRAPVFTRDQLMIGGFIIEGNEPKVVLIRGRGPSMGSAPFFVPGVLEDPFLKLYSGQRLIAQNDNWQDSPWCDPEFPCGGGAEIQATGLDPCQPNPGQRSSPTGCSQEAAIIAVLPPGAYTAILTGVGGQTGIGLVEVFEIDGDTNPSRLVNVSTRAAVQGGDNVLIGGVIVSGSSPKTYVIRGRGPSMAGAPFFVPGILSDPYLQIFSGQTVIAENNDWQDAPDCRGFQCGAAADILATGLDPCQPNPGETSAPPGCGREAAVLVTLPPGAYTAVLSGVNGASGIALVEIFELN